MGGIELAELTLQAFQQLGLAGPLHILQIPPLQVLRSHAAEEPIGVGVVAVLELGQSPSATSNAGAQASNT